MNAIKTKKLDTRDLITIGIFVAISLAIFFVVGGATGMTLIGTVANVPIIVFFTSIVYMLFVSRVRRRGTLLIMRTISTLSGPMAADVVGVIASAVGWFITEIVVSANHYKNRKVSIFAYVLGCIFHSAGYTLLMYPLSVQCLTDRQEIFHLTGEAFAVYLRTFTQPIFFIMVTLTAIASLLGVVLSTRILKKHFERAGLL